jgi:ABC-type dipeptide/oligopeptide/nickel transport system permease subunit
MIRLAVNRLSILARELAATAASLVSGMIVLTQDFSLQVSDASLTQAFPFLPLVLYIAALFAINGGMIFFVYRLTSSPGQIKEAVYSRCE